MAILVVVCGKIVVKCVVKCVVKLKNCQIGTKIGMVVKKKLCARGRGGGGRGGIGGGPL